MNRTATRIISLICAFLFIVPAFAFSAFAAEEKPFDNSEFYTEGKYTLHYRVFEAENEKGKMLMLHGFACSTSTWEPIADEMVENGYTCVLVDLPGFGYSTRETEVADEDVIARESLVINIMKTIAPINEWHVAGHSMGGGVAMNIACLEPTIKSLVLVCPCPITEVTGFAADMMASKPMGMMANFIFEKLTKITPLLRLVAYFAFMDWDFTMNYDLTPLSKPLQIHNTGYSNMITSVRAMPNDFEKISKLEMPVFVAQADKDLILNSTMKQQIADALPDATNYVVEGGGHMCNENRATEISEQILTFIEK
ncbi:MAG: alpha/beta hydrolase [Clostridia bacterium]|nr:alpha/beta hydrolase [Clostridia bacterium]